MSSPDSFDLFGTLRSGYFRVTSALVATVLAAALLINSDCLSIPKWTNDWFLVTDRLARAIVSSCTVLGYFGLFVLPLGLKPRDLERVIWRDYASKVRNRYREVELVLAVTLVIGFQFGFGRLFNVVLRIGDGIANLLLLLGLEIAGAFLWQTYLLREQF